MEMVVILFLLTDETPQAVYVGQTALAACYADALTYERPVACRQPASEVIPFMALKLTTSPRPQPRPES